MFPLGGVDIILGIAWLATLGEVIHNYVELTMSFELDPALCRNMVDLRMLVKMGDAELWAVVLDRELVDLSEANEHLRRRSFTA